MVQQRERDTVEGDFRVHDLNAFSAGGAFSCIFEPLKHVGGFKVIRVL